MPYTKSAANTAATCNGDIPDLQHMGTGLNAASQLQQAEAVCRDQMLMISGEMPDVDARGMTAPRCVRNRVCESRAA